MAHPTLFCGIFYTAVLLGSLVQTAEAARTYTLTFESAKCELKSKALEYFNCSINEGGSHPKSFNLHGKTRVPWVLLKMELLLMTSRSGYPNLVLLNLTDIDGCTFLEGRTTFNFMSILHKEFSKVVKLPNSCPIKKGYEVHIKNFYVTPDVFPPYLPDTKFRARTIMRDGSAVLTEMWMSGDIKSQKKSKG